MLLYMVIFVVMKESNFYEKGGKFIYPIGNRRAYFDHIGLHMMSQQDGSNIKFIGPNGNELPKDLYLYDLSEIGLSEKRVPDEYYPFEIISDIVLKTYDSYKRFFIAVDKDTHKPIHVSDNQYDMILDLYYKYNEKVTVEYTTEKHNTGDYELTIGGKNLTIYCIIDFMCPVEGTSRINRKNDINVEVYRVLEDNSVVKEGEYIKKRNY